MHRQKFSLILPEGFRITKTGFQNESLFLWAEVNRDAAKREYNFAVYGTGQDIPDQAEYISTYEIGPFVFHLYLLS